MSVQLPQAALVDLDDTVQGLTYVRDGRYVRPAA